MPAPAISTTAVFENFGSATSIPVTAFAAVTGRGILANFRWQESGITITGVTDTVGNTYTFVPGSLVTDGDWYIASYLCEESIGTNGSNVVTAALSGTSGNQQAVVHQFDVAVELDINAEGGVGVSANEVISDAFTTLTADALIIAVFGRNNSGGESLAWTPGSYATVGESAGGGSGGLLCTGYRSVTAIQTAQTVRIDTPSANNKKIAVVALIGGTTTTTGSLAVTVGAAASAATGTLKISGAASRTLGATTVAGVGTVAVSGALSRTLGAASANAAGTLSVSGAVSASVAAASVSAAGTLRITGAAARTLGAATLAAAGNTGTAPVITSVTGDPGGLGIVTRGGLATLIGTNL